MSSSHEQDAHSNERQKWPHLYLPDNSQQQTSPGPLGPERTRLDPAGQRTKERDKSQLVRRRESKYEQCITERALRVGAELSVPHLVFRQAECTPASRARKEKRLTPAPVSPWIPPSYASELPVWVLSGSWGFSHLGGNRKAPGQEHETRYWGDVPR